MTGGWSDLRQARDRDRRGKPTSIANTVFCISRARTRKGLEGMKQDHDQMAEILDRLAALEAEVEILRRGRPDTLTPAIRRATRGSWFTVSEVWRLAQAQTEAAASIGAPLPELAEAIEAEGIRSSHGLARWMVRRDGYERGGREAEGTLWRAPAG